MTTSTTLGIAGSFPYTVAVCAYDSNQLVTSSLVLTLTPDELIVSNGSLAVNENSAGTIGSVQISNTNGSATQIQTVVNPPSHGTVFLNVAQTETQSGTYQYEYVPNANYIGPDSFTLQASNGFAQSNIASVSVMVGTYTSQPPAANSFSIAVGENSTGSGMLYAMNYESASLTYTIVTAPSHGTLTLANASTGAYFYTPSANFLGSDSFTYKANDGIANSNTATVSISVAAIASAARLMLTAEEDAFISPICAPPVNNLPSLSQVLSQAPILISKPADLAAMTSGNRYQLSADISLEGQSWSPSTDLQNIVLDGQGHTISGLTLAGGLSGSFGGSAGLIGEATCAVIGNLTIQSPSVLNATAQQAPSAFNPNGIDSVGSLVGYAWGVVVRNVNVVNPQFSANNSAGALIGEAFYGMFTNVQSVGGFITGFVSAGGLIGETGETLTISNAAVAGSAVTSAEAAGGVVGGAEASVLTDVSSSATVVSNCVSGGILGSWGGNTSITNVMNTGNVSAISPIVCSGVLTAGGILGFGALGIGAGNNVSIQNVAAYGTVTATVQGGLAGQIAFCGSASPAANTLSVQDFYRYDNTDTGTTYVAPQVFIEYVGGGVCPGPPTEATQTLSFSEIYEVNTRSGVTPLMSGQALSQVPEKTLVPLTITQSPQILTPAQGLEQSSFSGWDFTLWTIDQTLGGPALPPPTTF